MIGALRKSACLRAVGDRDYRLNGAAAQEWRRGPEQNAAIGRFLPERV
jgi:hypothetical protein